MTFLAKVFKPEKLKSSPGRSVIGRGKIDEDGRIRDLLSEQACLEMIDFGRDCNIGRRKDIAAPHANFPHGNAEAIAKGGGG